LTYIFVTVFFSGVQIILYLINSQVFRLYCTAVNFQNILFIYAPASEILQSGWLSTVVNKNTDTLYDESFTHGANIVLEAGYFLQDRAFFDNIGTILLYAVVGTLFNAFTIGLSLYGISFHLLDLPLIQCLVFGALISAVDPVAVLAVFEEVKVNVMLYILVFGESLLNDAVTVVLYHMFEKMAEMDEVTYKEIFLGIANFLIVSVGGTLMGFLWGLATGLVTKYTDHVRVIEPIFVLIMSYLAYLSAEIFHLSGIMSIITCAITMKPYVERNISRKSHTTLKYVMKMLSSCSETLIFMFLGTTLVTYNHHWNTIFVVSTLLFVTIFRAIGVMSLTYFANRYGRLNKLSCVDQFVMCYGGIRGAVSFSLAILLSKDHFPLKDMIVTTTLVVVMFTVFVQVSSYKYNNFVLTCKVVGSFVFQTQLSETPEHRQRNNVIEDDYDDKFSSHRTPYHSQRLRYRVPPTLPEPTKPKHRKHHHQHHRKRRRGEGQELEGCPPKKLSTIFEPSFEDKVEEREKKLAEKATSEKTKDGEKNEGISFIAGGVRWKIGRQLSQEETERETKDESSSSRSSEDEDSSTGDELERETKLETVNKEHPSEGASKDSRKEDSKKGAETESASGSREEDVPAVNIEKGSLDKTEDGIQDSTCLLDYLPYSLNQGVNKMIKLVEDPPNVQELLGYLFRDYHWNNNEVFRLYCTAVNFQNILFIYAPALYFECLTFLMCSIVLEAGYFLQDKAFFDNIGTILLYAVVPFIGWLRAKAPNVSKGTLFNAFTVGLSLYGISTHLLGLPLLQCLVFGTLIAAVDPVAVLAVFEEVKVNVMLYILVFGESLLNDAVTVVLYHMFEKMAQMDEVTYKEIFLGIANFLIVSVGGTLMGFLWGLATGLVTKYTDHVRVIEPIFVLIMSYLAYLCAEIFHFSGIMRYMDVGHAGNAADIITCAIVMKPYVERNISRKSHTTLKYVMKMLSSCSETLIFMFLGTTLVTYNHHWNTIFVMSTLLFVTIFRAIGVISLTYVANRYGRLNKLSFVDQFVMDFESICAMGVPCCAVVFSQLYGIGSKKEPPSDSPEDCNESPFKQSRSVPCYGGIRGAVSFSLAILLSKDHFPLKDMIVTTTLVVVMFTVFVQGTTIKPLVKVLQVKLLKPEQSSMYSQLNDKLLDHLVAGMEEVAGHHGHSYYWQLCGYFHNHYLRRWLVRENESIVNDEDILLAYRKLEYKDALKYLEREGSGSLLFSSPSGRKEERKEEGREGGRRKEEREEGGGEREEGGRKRGRKEEGREGGRRKEEREEGGRKRGRKEEGREGGKRKEEREEGGRKRGRKKEGRRKEEREERGRKRGRKEEGREGGRRKKENGRKEGRQIETKKAVCLEYFAEGMDDNDPLLLRGGGLLRVPDSVVRDSRASTEPCESSMVVIDTQHNLSMYSLSNLLVKSRTAYSHRKFQRNNVIEDDYDDMFSSHRTPYHSQPLRFRVPPTLPEPTKPKHRKHHHRHHRKRRRGKGQELEGFPPKKKLSTIFEPQDDESKAEERERDLAEKAKSEITKDGEKDEGISFTAGAVRWKIGRQLSEEETERAKLSRKEHAETKDDESSSSSSSEDDDSSTGDELERETKLETVNEEHPSEGASKDSRKEDSKKGAETESASGNREENVPAVNIEKGSLDKTEDGSQVSGGNDS
ncbi:hypothetical protein QZH41_009540, partial [Actinostola sp. cb2023]